MGVEVPDRFAFLSAKFKVGVLGLPVQGPVKGDAMEADPKQNQKPIVGLPITQQRPSQTRLVPGVSKLIQGPRVKES